MTTPIVFNQITRDVPNETRLDQRFIGLLDQNRTRLNVNSALTARDDKEDVYRFRVTRGGNLGFSATVLKNQQIDSVNNGKIRVEILDRSGRPIADSKATSGQLQENYRKAQTDKLELRNGDYYVRVTRDRNVAPREVIEYTFQLRNGRFREDFDTTERPPPRQTQTNPNLAGTQIMTQQLNSLRTSVIGENSLFRTLGTLV